jgi:YYY domain-containing protein
MLDWLGREGGDMVVWWLLVTLAGAAVWPLLYRVLGGLPDRGYTVARAAGVMLTAFVFWFLASVGLLDNTPGSMVFAWLAVIALSLAVYFRWNERPPLRAWLRENAALIGVSELLFAVLFVGWSYFRAHNPDMASTEKPMEIMFLNSIRASATFPPHDAWLSGYSISYYYFGYVMAAMLSDLAGVNSGIGFDLMLAFLFAQAGVGALGVVYNMIRSRGPVGLFPGGSRAAALGAGALALVALVLMGNLGTALIELPYRGAASGIASQGYFEFWDVAERDGTTSSGQVPDSDHDLIADWDDGYKSLDKWDYWWWFRYSRVIRDRDLDGTPISTQPIAEFPAFSFVLADMHPHVLALPFAVLAVALSLNLVLRGRDPTSGEIALYAVWVGGMVFLNSWDAAYVVLLVGAEALRRLIRNGSRWLTVDDLLGVVWFAARLGALTLVFYLPWIYSFASQAGGLLPNAIYPTQWQQMFLQFGTFLVILTVFMAVEAVRAGRRFNWTAALLTALITAGTVLLLAAVLGVIAWNRDDVRGAVYAIYGSVGGLGDIVPDVLKRRLVGLPTELWLLALIALVVGRLFARPLSGDPDDEPVSAYSPAAGFALLLVGAAVVLVLVPDFVYLRDNFSVRMNTVFKLYYQGWILFSMAAGYAVWAVLAGREATTPRKAAGADSPLALVGRATFGAAAVVLVAAGLLYSFYAPRSRGVNEANNTDPLTLDGRPTMVTAGEYEAIMCFSDLVPKSDTTVLAEASCNCGYQPQIGRVSGLSGIPTLLGWANHEGQWRGETYSEVTDARTENGQYRDRMTDINDLLTTRDWDTAWSIIDRYGVDYVVVGNAERNLASSLSSSDSQRQDYEQGLAKFAQVMTPVCQNDTMAIYRVAPN